MENSQTYFPCVSVSQAAIEDITGQDKSALLSILQRSTGLGKTYGTVRDRQPGGKGNLLLDLLAQGQGCRRRLTRDQLCG